MSIPLDFCYQGDGEPTTSLAHDAVGEQEFGVRCMTLGPAWC